MKLGRYRNCRELSMMRRTMVRYRGSNKCRRSGEEGTSGSLKKKIGSVRFQPSRWLAVSASRAAYAAGNMLRSRLASTTFSEWDSGSICGRGTCDDKAQPTDGGGKNETFCASGNGRARARARGRTKQGARHIGQLLCALLSVDAYSRGERPHRHHPAAINTVR